MNDDMYQRYYVVDSQQTTFLRESKTKVNVIHPSSLRRPMRIDHFDICGQVVASSFIVGDVAIDDDLLINSTG